MIKNVHEVIPEVAEAVRGGSGSVTAHKLLDLFPGSAIKSVGLVRLEPGASVGDHSHKGDEDFYFCIALALQTQGIPVEVHLFANEGHGFRSGAVRIEVLEATEAFFRRHFQL